MGKNRKTLNYLAVAATLEKANTYVFAERLIRNAEARSSTLLCSTNNLSAFNKFTFARSEDPIFPSGQYVARKTTNCLIVSKLSIDLSSLCPKRIILKSPQSLPH